MIIFGTRSSVSVLAIVYFVCGHCSNPVAQRILKRVNKFTLFFVPLFPVSSSYYVSCAYCGTNTKIDRPQADSYVEFADNARIEQELEAEFGAEEQAAQPPAEQSREADRSN